MNYKKNGFTLAEVLITLGIIGVVAAMTIPTLISNTNSAKFKSQYKKTLSTLNQAVKMAEAKYDINFASLIYNCPSNKISEGAAFQTLDVAPSVCAVWQTTLSGATDLGNINRSIKINGTNTNYSITRNLTIDASADQIRAYLLADGAFVAFHNNLKSCTLETGGDISTLPVVCQGYIDVNGGTLPNKEVACSDGTAKISSTVGSCIVRNNANDMGDIFPVVFHDGIVEPATNAARYVLNNAK